jgi:CPA2 family monovalent cation:H+ antiporter-2
MEFWPILFDVGVLLGVAFALGALCERLHQSALLGYLIAGMLLGPNALHVVSTSTEVEGLAKVGVCLLLFSLGLEFSWRRLRGLGVRALGSGFVQVALTLFVVASTMVVAGGSVRAAVVLGAAFALSSTAGVLRVLMGRSELDSVHGRHALGILLFQDLSVIALVLLAGFLATPGSHAAALWDVGRTGLMLLIMILVFYVVFSQVVPRVLLVTALLRNRELPVLFAVVGALGSIYTAHEFGLSPAVGAFIAGMLLGESPFATQVRADLSVLRTLLVTVFFSSVGMLADPAWIVDHIGLTATVAVSVVVVKTFVCFGALRVMRQSAHASLAAAICLSQVGEFGFVIAETARGSLIDDQLFMVIVSTMMVTLLMTPYLIAAAPRISARLLRPFVERGVVRKDRPAPDHEDEPPSGHVVVIGYGPAGARCSELLREGAQDVVVLDLNPNLVADAQGAGFDAHVGDGTHPDVLEHLHIGSAAAVVVALPDPRTAEKAVRAIRCAADRVPIVVRSRYHKHIELLEPAGASVVVDEEREVGVLLGERTRRILTNGGGEASDLSG